MHCLNCGQRFRLPQQTGTDGNFVSGEVEEVDQNPSRSDVVHREPASPSYAYLRIVGILLLILGVVLTGFCAYETIRMLFRRSFFGRTENLWLLVLSFAPLLVGLWSFCCTELPSLLDSLFTKMSWRMGKMEESLPLPPGGSLTYVLPTSAAGGLLGFSIIFQGLEFGDVDVFILGIGALFIGLGLLSGFAIEDLRLFLWRQALLVGRLTCQDPARARLKWPCELPWSLTGMCTVAVTVSVALAMVGIWIETNLVGHDSLIMFVSILLICAFGWTMAKLVRGLERANGVWKLAASREKPQGWPAHESLLIRWGIRLPYVWIAMGSITLMSILIQEGRWIDGEEFIIIVGFSAALLFFAVLLSRLLKDLYTLRSSQESVFGLRSGGMTGALPLALFIALGVWAMLHLLVGVFVSIEVLSSSWRWVSQLFAVITVFLGFSYLAFWMALSFREVRHLLQLGKSAMRTLAQENVQG